MNRDNYIPTMKAEVKSLTFWRDAAGECLSTFFLVFANCSIPLTWDPLDSATHPRNTGNVVQTALGMGFLVMGISGSISDYGGAFMNPSVTFAMVITRRITLSRGLIYLPLQCLGAYVAAILVKSLIPVNVRGGLATTTVAEDVTLWQAFLIEAWITLFHVTVVLGATNIRWKGHLYMPNVPIGFSVTCATLVAYSSTGASMNSARSFGPALAMGIWDDHWVYWVGPIIGGVLAALLYLLFDIPGEPAEVPPEEPEASGSKTENGKAGENNEGFNPEESCPVQ